ncbi:MAG: hypothetical protein VX726_09300 [Planctomycetota bacterium]|nr:hypothetical protein [Planctomycetota bacterium]
MNLGIFLVMLFVCVALDTSLLPVISIGGVSPSVTATLIVFVSLFAPRQAALWAAVSAGLLLDLQSPNATTDGRAVVVPGPYALGFVFGTQLVLLLRSMVFRRNPIAVGLLTTPFLIAVSLVWMAIWLLRGFDPGSLLPWSGGNAGGELGRRAGWALYSGAIGIPFGWLLLFSWPIWRFEQTFLRR